MPDKVKPVEFHYSFPHAQFKTSAEAVIYAKIKLVKEWAPLHWHLDMVQETEKFYSITFHAVPSGLWHGGSHENDDSSHSQGTP